MTTQLHVLRGGIALESFRISPGLHVLGSGAEADLVLGPNEPEVVCRVELNEEGGVFLRTLDDAPLSTATGVTALEIPLENADYAEVKGLRLLRLNPSKPPKVTFDLPKSPVRTAPSRNVTEPPRELLALKITASGSTHVVEVEADEIYLGRGPGNVVSFNHPEVSRRHARIFHGPDGLWIEDLGSVHGTLMGNTKITGSRLKLGSKVKLSEALDAPVIEVASLSDALSERGVDEAVQPIRGRGEQMQDLRSTLLRHGKSDFLALLLGENGTGKEVAARALASLRGGPFVAVNCGAIPDTLIESELFGTMRGAYTGAVDRAGKFEQAKNGTILLDEVGELSMAAQTGLLRVLESRELTRIGDIHNTVIPVRCRIVAATNRDLAAMVKAGNFREDLFHRIFVLVIRLPPLRAHLSDIPELARQHLRDRSGRTSGKTLSDEALTKLLGYAWPGNVRELVNTLDRAAVKPESDGGVIPASAIVFTHELDSKVSSQKDAAPTSLKAIGNMSEQLNALERGLCERAMEEGGTLRKAAAMLQISETSFRRCLTRHGLLPALATNQPVAKQQELQ